MLALEGFTYCKSIDGRSHWVASFECFLTGLRLDSHGSSIYVFGESWHDESHIALI